jgi:hypothetical protein
MKGDARPATDLALSPMMGKGPKRYGMRIPSRLWQIEQIRHDGAACSRRTIRPLLRTIGGALVQPIRQPVARPQLLEEARNMVATLPAARRTFEAQDLYLPTKPPIVPSDGM